MGEILDSIISDYNEELASVDDESYIPNRYGMEYCTVVATRYGQALGLDHSRGQDRIAELERSWTSCDTPPDSERCVWLTTCPRGGKGRRTVHQQASFSSGAWWHRYGGRIQDVPVSWMDEFAPPPDEITEPNEEARSAEVEKSCAIMRGES